MKGSSNITKMSLTTVLWIASLVISTTAQQQQQQQPAEFRTQQQEPQFQPPPILTSEQQKAQAQLVFQDPSVFPQETFQARQQQNFQQPQQNFQQPQQNFQQPQQNFQQQPARPAFQQQQPQQNFNDFSVNSGGQETLPTLPPVFIPPNNPIGPPPNLQSPIRNLFRQPDNGFSFSNLISRFFNLFNLNSN